MGGANPDFSLGIDDAGARTRSGWPWPRWSPRPPARLAVGSDWRAGESRNHRCTRTRRSPGSRPG